ncbi:hypothetical protein [Segetibacter aerophilus]|uniref:Uncharacterized protein n=1 Tax=Segetibacter aerophilus TaxID=670293 RepID=A0A512B9H7_9BACT|nr:hypothetical protein [Segetibacter aerophilus]GEO08614.1 hypothetical protein SAE01_11100 [Segetibacter aerophilus]
MKKAIIGAIVGAIILFGWQAVSHMFMHHQESAYRQVENQEKVIQALAGMFKEDGQYLVPRSNPKSSQEEMAKFDEGRQGKPFAIVTYHTADKSNMGMSAIRSFTTAFLSVLIFIWLLGKNRGSFATIFLKTIGLAILIFIFVYYNSNIWLQTPWDVIRPELIDLLAAWGLTGIWLGWWLNKGRERR